MGPKLMDCGHWSYWFYDETCRVLDGRKREFMDFGPGCLACEKGYPKQYEVLVRQTHGVEETPETIPPQETQA